MRRFFKEVGWYLLLGALIGAVLGLMPSGRGGSRDDGGFIIIPNPMDSNGSPLIFPY